MIFYHVALLLLPFCVGQSPSCCMPRQATYDTLTIGSEISSAHGGFHSYERSGKTYLDFDRKVRFKVHTKTENGQDHHVVTYTDFNIGKTFEVEDGHCVVRDAVLINGTMMSNCFPGPNEGKSYIGRETFGNTLTDVWRIDQMQSQGLMAVIHISVSDCLVMAETDYGSIQGVQTQSTTFAYNAIPRIDDSTVFSVPPECNQKQKSEGQH